MIDADKLLAEPVHEPETKNKRKEKSKVKKIKKLLYLTKQKRINYVQRSLKKNNDKSIATSVG